MEKTRRIRKLVTAQPTVEGAGVNLHRAMGWLEPPETYDPFLLLDDFRSDNPADYVAGFPWHPHRGMETVTYVLKGEAEHQDSLGNKGTIGPGDVQWMSAGSGIIHQEMPKGDAAGSMHGFQLWVNLPKASKMGEPRYRGITADMIPAVKREGGVLVRVIAGDVDGMQGAAQDVAGNPEYLDVTLPAAASFVHPTTLGRTVFAYVIEGDGNFEGGEEPAAGNRHLVSFEDGDQVSVRAGKNGVRFLLISGRPLREPIAWRGPIVMNTQLELREAFEELDRDTFIKHARTRSH